MLRVIHIADSNESLYIDEQAVYMCADKIQSIKKIKAPNNDLDKSTYSNAHIRHEDIDCIIIYKNNLSIKGLSQYFEGSDSYSIKIDKSCTLTDDDMKEFYQGIIDTGKYYLKFKPIKDLKRKNRITSQVVKIAMFTGLTYIFLTKIHMNIPEGTSGTVLLKMLTNYLLDTFPKGILIALSLLGIFHAVYTLYQEIANPVKTIYAKPL